jgi:hypothetical protein
MRSIAAGHRSTRRRMVWSAVRRERLPSACRGLTQLAQHVRGRIAADCQFARIAQLGRWQRPSQRKCYPRTALTCRKQILCQPNAERMRAQAADIFGLNTAFKFEVAKIDRRDDPPTQDRHDAPGGSVLCCR